MASAIPGIHNKWYPMPVPRPHSHFAPVVRPGNRITTTMS